MPIVSLVNLKGGVGKSTTAVHLATYLARDARTLLIDTDRQGSAAAWAVWRQEVAPDQPAATVVRLYDREVVAQGKALAAGYEWTVIDTRGSDSPSTRAALVLSDLALVPLRDSEYDAAAIDDLLQVLEEARMINPGLKVLAYLAQVDKRARFPADHIKFLRERQITALDTYLSFRRAYVRSSDGHIVDELGDPTAAMEMAQLLADVRAAVAQPAQAA